MKNRDEIINEIKLRRLIRRAIKIKEVKFRKAQEAELQEEKELRKIIKFLIKEGDIDADTEPAPHGSTPINLLADAFNQVLEPLKTGLRRLSRPEERASYRIHILEKLKNIFDGFEALDQSNPEMKVGESDINEQEEEEKITIKLDDPDRVLPSDGKEDVRYTEKEKTPEEKEEEAFEEFAIAGQDPTGAAEAYETFKNSNIQTLLADKRAILHNPKDKKTFRDYAEYNADLWMITYEEELARTQGQQPAFTETIISRPEGAKVEGAGAEVAQREDDELGAIGDMA